MRAPYNVLVLPYTIEKGDISYCIFKRRNLSFWQFLSGGGENREGTFQTAQRESLEGAGISKSCRYARLESMSYVPANRFPERDRQSWGKRYVIPVYAFSVKVGSFRIHLSEEYSEYRWCDYQEVKMLLQNELDRTALYELNEWLKHS